MEIDLLNVDPVDEQEVYKLKKLVQAPNSFFMDVKCHTCQNVTTVFSHPQNVVICNK